MTHTTVSAGLRSSLYIRVMLTCACLLTSHNHHQRALGPDNAFHWNGLGLLPYVGTKRYPTGIYMCARETNTRIHLSSRQLAHFLSLSLSLSLDICIYIYIYIYMHACIHCACVRVRACVRACVCMLMCASQNMLADVIVAYFFLQIQRHLLFKLYNDSDVGAVDE